MSSRQVSPTSTRYKRYAHHSISEVGLLKFVLQIVKLINASQGKQHTLRQRVLRDADALDVLQQGDQHLRMHPLRFPNLSQVFQHLEKSIFNAWKCDKDERL